LKSYPPSSRSTPDRKESMMACFAGNLRHRDRIASTTTILNSSVMSAMKEEICFMSRSTDASFPVYLLASSTQVLVEHTLRRVVMA